MRGALELALSRTPGVRIIPAYAGSTDYKGFSSKVAQDHPRVCGEHAWFLSLSMVYRGSSPRMRGARATGNEDMRHGRIIPAYAGSTIDGVGGKGIHEDHPRVCGEHRYQQ